MIRGAALTLLLAFTFAGCRTAENVASTSAAVVTAPAHFVRNKFRQGEQTTTETTGTTIYEGQPVVAAPPQPTPTPVRSPRTVTSTTTSPPSQQEETGPSTAATPRPSATPRNSSSTSAHFPVAKPVPGKPGYVFSPYDPNGGYVDVTGYQSGSKVKDPYSQKIFLVP
jgi:hypothetical protein